MTVSTTPVVEEQAGSIPNAIDSVKIAKRNFWFVQVDGVGIGIANAAAQYLAPFLTLLNATNLQVGKHGAKHRDCGQKCARNGQPVGLLTKDGTLYMIMPEEHDPRRDGGVDIRTAGSEHMGHIVTVTGTEASHNGYRGLFVKGLTK